MSGPGASDALGRERIVGLDVWRALLMSGGLFVHGSIGLQTMPLFRAIGDISQAFRMGVFIILSGVLAAALLAKRDRRAWLRGRMLHLGVPAAFGVLVLSPVIFALFAAARGPVSGRPHFLFEWHHLWFLYALLAYALVAVAMDGSPAVARLIARIDAAAGTPRSGRIAILATAAVAAPLMVTAMPVLEMSLSPTRYRALAVAELIPGYLPMFVLGYVLARSPALSGAMIGRSRFAIGIIAGAVLANVAVRTVDGLAGLGDHVRLLGTVLCPPAVFVLVLRSAMSIRRVPDWLKGIADASYTIYLLHVPIIVLLSTQVTGGLDPHLAYAINVMVAGVASYAAHRLVVRRGGIAALLVNGRIHRLRIAPA